MSALLVTPRGAEAAVQRHRVPPTLAESAAATNATLPPTERPALFDGITLRVPGSSRFGGTVRGRDTVVAHLRAMGIRWEALSTSKPLVSLAPNQDVWLATIPLEVGADAPHTLTALISATRNVLGEITSLDLFIHDEAQLTRRAPREDGVQRTSLAAQRNLRQVRALHGNGRATRFLGANGARVLAILHPPVNGPPQIVEYRFDAAGHVVSLHSAPPTCLTARESCCSSSDSVILAELLAVVGQLH